MLYIRVFGHNMNNNFTRGIVIILEMYEKIIIIYVLLYKFKWLEFLMRLFL